MPTLTDNIVEKVVKKLDPRNQLLRVWSLSGGISAEMIAFEYLAPDGEKAVRILRYPRAEILRYYPDILDVEYKTLSAVQKTSIPSQICYLFDNTKSILPEGYLILEFIKGQSQFALSKKKQIPPGLARQLAAIHGQAWAASDIAHLPDFLTGLKARLDEASRPSDRSMQQDEIQDALKNHWPDDDPQKNTLLHGDFWLGNVLWRDDKIVGVIDWEDAEIGNPLADLAVTRLEMMWTFGADAMAALTAQYQQLTGASMTGLPFYDLVAALRPVHNIAEWAEGWPDFGRPDVTEETLRAAHTAFVNQALAALETQN